MKHLLLTTIAAVVLITNTEARKPNLVVIYTDDQGSIDINSYGAKDLITPAMDSLCRDGVRFTQFYSAAAVCSPSRAALLTGRVPNRAGVPGNVSSHPGGRGALPVEGILELSNSTWLKELMWMRRTKMIKHRWIGGG